MDGFLLRVRLKRGGSALLVISFILIHFESGRIFVEWQIKDYSDRTFPANELEIRQYK